MGPYDWHYDRNGDGVLDAHEEYERQDFIDYMNKTGLYEEDDSEIEDDLDDELELSGLSRDELEYMDDDERAETLEDAGIDPDNWEDF